MTMTRPFDPEPNMRDTKDSGATAVEYALMLAFITGVIIAAVLVLGTKVLGLFSSVPPF
jgi:Flp pilus assembly pilin Flp